ncbi:pantoate--beta-alanine ligase [Planococcus lenghuensis]|uniref:Pantothenate synthetase n=1 Tax=Planococcus lenghuensis TaxID=2213202 RepID=A0A1Q2KZI0_9BACL|nr:pantoate--beta-alanine ligase [Planococcus lenghuensis]AQQ53608.1 pantoate--beta-alanine ligase [Planococcus lenghuensis]
MNVIETKQGLKCWVATMKQDNRSIGFVPTMGFLHEGHLSLIRQARKENDVVIVSIFVNPAQFGPGEDFERYPRDLPKDTALAESVGADVLFVPSAEEMYPAEAQVTLTAGPQADRLCGRSRPGHFDGVLKVVTKLFHLTEADRAYFGQKDAQQLAIIESLVRDFDFPVEIRRGATVREEDGLAKSSRNVYLSPEERSEAPAIHEALRLGREATLSGRDPVPVMADHIERHTSGTIDYIEFLSYPELTEPIGSGEAVLAVAVQFEKARLIDNVILNLKEKY